MANSELEQELLFHIKALKIKQPVEEYTFARPRRWRFDFAWVDEKIAAECEGGVYSRGRHVRPTGFINDCDKYNTATLLGWRVFRFTAEHIHRGDAVEMIRKALQA